MEIEKMVVERIEIVFQGMHNSHKEFDDGIVFEMMIVNQKWLKKKEKCSR